MLTRFETLYRTLRWAGTTAWAGAFAVSMIVAGCGGDQSSTEREVSTRTAPAPRAISLPVPDAVSADTALAAPGNPAVAPATAQPAREVTYADAEAAYFDRRYAGAVEMFRAYCDQKPANPWGHYMLGLSAWKAGDLETAEKSLGRVLELDPRHVKSRINLGRVLLDAGRPAEARDQAGEALAVDAGSNAAYRLRGRANHRLALVDAAIDDYRRAIEIDSSDAWAINNLALIYIEQERFEEALPALARATAIRPDVAIFQNNMGIALERTGHYRAAEAAYESAVALDGAYENAALNLERIAGVAARLDTAPVDPARLADSFDAAVMEWSSSADATGSIGVVASDSVVPLVAIDGDTNGDQGAEFVAEAPDTTR